MSESYAISSRYRVILQVARVPAGKKFPNGIKAKYVLIDVDGGFPRLLLDNHEPFGFHMHTRLPEDESHRVSLSLTDYRDALDLFLL
jgi:hypothetical protein